MMKRMQSSGVWAGLMLSALMALPLAALLVGDSLRDPRNLSGGCRACNAVARILWPWLGDELTFASLCRSAVAVAGEIAVFGSVLGDIKSYERSGLRYFAGFAITFAVSTVILDVIVFCLGFILSVHLHGFA